MLFSWFVYIPVNFCTIITVSIYAQKKNVQKRNIVIRRYTYTLHQDRQEDHKPHKVSRTVLDEMFSESWEDHPCKAAQHSSREGHSATHLRRAKVLAPLLRPTPLHVHMGAKPSQATRQGKALNLLVFTPGSWVGLDFASVKGWVPHAPIVTTHVNFGS